jgi:hypothetical protein
VGLLTLNLSFELEVDFFSHNLQNSQEAAGKTTIFGLGGAGDLKIESNMPRSVVRSLTMHLRINESHCSGAVIGALCGPGARM